MSVLNQRVERDFKSVIQAPMVLADTLNQPVTGSSPVRLTLEIPLFANRFANICQHRVSGDIVAVDRQR